MSEPSPRARRLRKIACVLLLITLALPFSRCGSTPGPVTTGSTALVQTPPPPPPPPPPPDPWYSVLIGMRNSPNYSYKYGYELFIDSWEVPDQFDVILLIPGRMFYVWPIAALVLIRWIRVRLARMGFYSAEWFLAVGSMWWVMVPITKPLSGFYIAETALALYAIASLWDLVLEIRAWCREKRAG